MAHGTLVKVNGIVFCRAHFTDLGETTGAKNIATIPEGFRPSAEVYFPLATTAILAKSGTEGEIFGHATTDGSLAVAGIGRQVMVNAWWFAN